MATKLNKIIIRETKLDGKDLFVEISPSNTISFRFKSSKKSSIISFNDIMEYISDNSTESLDNITDDAIINLHDFRSQYLISGELDYKTKVILEKITLALICNK